MIVRNRTRLQHRKTITMPSVEPPDTIQLFPGPAQAAATTPAKPPPSESPPVAQEPLLERRGHATRFSPQEILQLSVLQGLYRKEFGQPLDVERFANDDPYGRQVLSDAMTSGSSDLMAAAWCFLDSEGKPHRHRRNR